VGELLPRFWALAQKLGSAKEAPLSGTQIHADELSYASTRFRANEDAIQVSDDRYALRFALTGTLEECLARAQYKAADIDELALTFSGATAKEGIAAIGTASTWVSSASRQA
jgi:5,10-methylenetetrahydromethanopterin reductase